MKMMTIALILLFSLVAGSRADTPIDVRPVELPVTVRFLNDAGGGLLPALDFRSARIEFISTVFGGPQSGVDRTGSGGPTFNLEGDVIGVNTA